MPVESTDCELLRRVAGGDETAFALLLKRHQDKIYALIYRYVHDAAAAEDLCQDTFFKVWKYARTFRGQAAVRTWLYRLAVNTCLNYREKQRIRPRTLPLTADIQSDGGQADDELRAAGREELLQQALSRLPERQRMAVLLASFSGHSYEEIAQIMDVSLGAVESLLFRARQNLAAQLRRPEKK
ncbi:MAG TPA: sigma-70 family RNA polymerase sigma factor [Candidatus Aminicenantes bacterium]|nr:sigma-70 family RNA polymerase sigma factor [Candidatus Aminicenantes bacterium]